MYNTCPENKSKNKNKNKNMNKNKNHMYNLRQYKAFILVVFI